MVAPDKPSTPKRPSENTGTLWGGASLSKQLIWLHMNRLVSFMLKSRAESLAFMSAIYARALPVCIICTVCEQPAIDGQSVAAVTNKQ